MDNIGVNQESFALSWAIELLTSLMEQSHLVSMTIHL